MVGTPALAAEALGWWPCLASWLPCCAALAHVAHNHVPLRPPSPPPQPTAGGCASGAAWRRRPTCAPCCAHCARWPRAWPSSTPMTCCTATSPVSSTGWDAARQASWLAATPPACTERVEEEQGLSSQFRHSGRPPRHTRFPKRSHPVSEPPGLARHNLASYPTLAITIAQATTCCLRRWSQRRRMVAASAPG